MESLSNILGETNNIFVELNISNSEFSLLTRFLLFNSWIYCVHKLRVQVYELRVQIYESRVQKRKLENSHAFELVARLFELVTYGFELVTRESKLAICEVEIVTRKSELVTGIS